MQRSRGGGLHAKGAEGKVQNSGRGAEKPRGRWVGIVQYVDRLPDRWREVQWTVLLLVAALRS